MYTCMDGWMTSVSSGFTRPIVRLYTLYFVTLTLATLGPPVARSNYVHDDMLADNNGREPGHPNGRASQPVYK